MVLHLCVHTHVGTYDTQHTHCIIHLFLTPPKKVLSKKSMFIDIFRMINVPCHRVESGGHQIFLPVKSWELG